eukprot:750414-Hanusia_phi.AAC.7
MIAVQSKLRSLEREVPQALELEQLRLNQPETSMNYFVEEKSSVIMDAARLSRGALSQNVGCADTCFSKQSDK